MATDKQGCRPVLWGIQPRSSDQTLLPAATVGNFGDPLTGCPKPGCGFWVFYLDCRAGGGYQGAVVVGPCASSEVLAGPGWPSLQMGASPWDLRVRCASGVLLWALTPPGCECKLISCKADVSGAPDPCPSRGLPQIGCSQPGPRLLHPVVPGILDPAWQRACSVAAMHCGH